MMTPTHTSPQPFSTLNQFQDADKFYEQLLDAHQGLSADESEALNARLILVLANQIGDEAVLSGCITAALAAK